MRSRASRPDLGSQRVGASDSAGSRATCASFRAVPAPRTFLPICGAAHLHLHGLDSYRAEPWKSLDGLYAESQLAAYRNQPLGEKPPHLYALADSAYRGLVQDGDDQTILVSGESGAGKTESTRRLLEFLVAVSSRSRKLLPQQSRPPLPPGTSTRPSASAAKLKASGAMLAPRGVLGDACADEAPAGAQTSSRRCHTLVSGRLLHRAQARYRAACMEPAAARQP